MSIRTAREAKEVGGHKLFHFFFLLLFLASAFCIFHIQSSAVVAKNARQLRFALPAAVLPRYGFGFNMVACDLLWLRLLQDIGFKESEKVSLGVVYRMIDAMTTFDPRFKTAYTVGLSALSVLVSDVEGGELLYERAVNQYPDDWHILFAAGYHNLYESHHCTRAAELFSNAARKGAPYWVGFLAEKIYTRTGQYDLAKAALEDAVQHFEDEKAKNAVRDKLSDLEKNRDATKDGKNSPLVKCAAK